MRKKVKEESN